MIHMDGQWWAVAENPYRPDAVAVSEFNIEPDSVTPTMLIQYDRIHPKEREWIWRGILGPTQFHIAKTLEQIREALLGNVERYPTHAFAVTQTVFCKWADVSQKELTAAYKAFVDSGWMIRIKAPDKNPAYTYQFYYGMVFLRESVKKQIIIDHKPMHRKGA